MYAHHIGTLPTLGNLSPSDFGRKSDSFVANTVHDAPLYAHWFALELYNQFHLIKKAQEAQPVQCELAGTQHTIPAQSLEIVATAFSKVCSFPDISDGDVGTCDLALTACFARALDRFLFPDIISAGACMHQFPINKNKSAIHHPDLYVTGLCDECPVNPVLLGVYKHRDFSVARRETAGYVIESMCTENSTWTTKLGLAFSGDKAKLFVYVACDGYVHQIEVCEIDFRFSSPRDCHAFFAVLFGAVHTLLQKQQLFISDIPPTMVPLFGSDLCEWIKNEKECRLFRSADKKTVYKMYDSEHRRFSPNFCDAMTSIRTDYLPGMSLEKLDTQGRVQCLQYSYIRGDHDPQHLQHFRDIIRDLGKLHDEGYVHSDIREQNLLFGNENQAWMIDFDHTDKEGTRYPDTYNHNGIEERHSSARAGWPRQKKHDRYALSVILEKFDFQGKDEIVLQLRDPQNKLTDIALLL